MWRTIKTSHAKGDKYWPSKASWKAWAEDNEKKWRNRYFCCCETVKKAHEHTRSQPTCAHKLLLLHLSHIVPPQVRRRHALRVETQAGALSQPLGEPGDMAVTLQVVGVQAAGQGGGDGECLTDGEGRGNKGDESRWGKRKWNGFDGGENKSGGGRRRESTDQSIDWRINSLSRNVDQMCFHLQSPEFWHVIKAGHRQTADVVVIEGAEKQITHQ